MRFRSKERGTIVKDRAKNRKSSSSGVFCSETKRKRLLRRLYELFPRKPGLTTAFARVSLIKTMENGSSSRFVVSILLSKRFTVKKLSWCLFCHSLLLHLNDDTRQKNIFFCRVPWRVLPPNIWSLTAIKANCRSKGKLFICFWSMCSAQISFLLTFRHISRSETAHLLVPYPDSAWDKEGARSSKPWDKGKARSRKNFFGLSGLSLV